MANLLFNFKYLSVGQTNFVKYSAESRKRKFPAVSSSSSIKNTKRMLGEDHAGK